jgi:hypothetical protein
MSYAKLELPNPDDEIWQRVMANTMNQTLNQMVFRSFLGGISGIDTATGSSATVAHVKWRDETVEMPQLGFCPATPTRHSPASELIIEGKAEVIVDEASQIPDDAWRYVEETLLLIEEISK